MSLVRQLAERPFKVVDLNLHLGDAFKLESRGSLQVCDQFAALIKGALDTRELLSEGRDRPPSGGTFRHAGDVGSRSGKASNGV